MSKVVLSGGGTGGHLYPGIAIAEELKLKGVDCLFLVSDRGIDRDILSRTDFNFIEQKLVAFKGKNIVGKIMSLFKLLPATLKVVPKINKNDKVILLGGFASVTAGIVSIFKHNNLYIHEQNSIMGMTNGMFARFADKVFLSFEKTLNIKGNCVVTGNPVRKCFDGFKTKEYLNKNLLITGGSQGSRFINELIANSADALLEKGFVIRHQAGKKLYEETLNIYKKKGLLNNENIKLTEYINDMKTAYEEADVIISRAGSGSIFEITYSKRPAIYIPLKIAADNHQKMNALAAAEFSSAKVLEEFEANKENLMKCINEIYEDYENIKKKLDKIEFKDTAKIILREMEID